MNYNGRVDLKTPNTTALFTMYDKIPATQCSTFRDPTQGLWSETVLSKVFFSKQNIQIIQNGIRKGVYDKSQTRILVDNQPEDQIVTIMRAMYLQYSKNLEINIPQQIQELNNFVLNFCIISVFNEAVAYLKYKEDASTMHKPMQHPIYSNKTNKTLEQKAWF